MPKTNPSNFGSYLDQVVQKDSTIKNIVEKNRALSSYWDTETLGLYGSLLEAGYVNPGKNRTNAKSFSINFPINKNKLINSFTAETVFKGEAISSSGQVLKGKELVAAYNQDPSISNVRALHEFMKAKNLDSTTVTKIQAVIGKPSFNHVHISSSTPKEFREALLKDKRNLKAWNASYDTAVAFGDMSPVEYEDFVKSKIWQTQGKRFRRPRTGEPGAADILYKYKRQKYALTKIRNNKSFNIKDPRQLKAYLRGWGNVADLYTKASLTAPTNIKANLDAPDLVRGVVAKAQSQGYMTPTGKLFGGTNLEYIRSVMWGMDKKALPFFKETEAHTALWDAILAWQADERFLVINQLLNKKKLTVEEKDFLTKFFATFESGLEAQEKINVHSQVLGILKDPTFFKIRRYTGRKTTVAINPATGEKVEYPYGSSFTEYTDKPDEALAALKKSYIKSGVDPLQVDEALREIRARQFESGLSTREFYNQYEKGLEQLKLKYRQHPDQVKLINKTAKQRAKTVKVGASVFDDIVIKGRPVNPVKAVGLSIGALALLGVGYNIIGGLHPGAGQKSRYREGFHDFGSGWRGLSTITTKLSSWFAKSGVSRTLETGGSALQRAQEARSFYRNKAAALEEQIARMQEKMPVDYSTLMQKTKELSMWQARFNSADLAANKAIKAVDYDVLMQGVKGGLHPDAGPKSRWKNGFLQFGSGFLGLAAALPIHGDDVALFSYLFGREMNSKQERDGLHPGSGSKSKWNNGFSDFGSGWLGFGAGSSGYPNDPHPELSPAYNAATDIPAYKLWRASKIGLSENQLYNEMISKPSVGSEYVYASAQAGTALHQYLEADWYAKKWIKGAEQLVGGPEAGFAGHMDVILNGGEVLDIKTLNKGRFASMMAKGEPHPSHVSQVRAYMGLIGQTKPGYIAYVQRDNPAEMMLHKVPWDPLAYQADIEKLHRVQDLIGYQVTTGQLEEDKLAKTASYERLKAEQAASAGELQAWASNVEGMKDIFEEEQAYLDSIPRGMPSNLSRLRFDRDRRQNYNFGNVGLMQQMYKDAISHNEY